MKFYYPFLFEPKEFKFNSDEKKLKKIENILLN